MKPFVDGIRTVVGLELRQRVRGAAWYVLLGVFFLVLLIVTILATMASGFSGSSGAVVYSTVAYVVLLMATLVSPALSGAAINGDREAATLAPVQVTLLSTTQIVLGKFFAAWLTGLSFLVVAAPFMIFAAIVSGTRPEEYQWSAYAETDAFVSPSPPPGLGADTVFASLAVLVVEVGVIAAIGVALSGVLAKPLLSVVTTYLVVAALSIGTVIAFGLGGTALSSQGSFQVRSYEYDLDTGVPTTDPPTCGEWSSQPRTVPRFDRVWGFLAANPYVILADATPLRFNGSGYPTDLFGQIASSVRIAQKTPALDETYDECAPQTSEQFPTTQEQMEGTVPSWFVGIGIHLLLAGGGLWWAVARTRTPARILPPGTRIA
jgi:hypothetical protein